MADDGLMKILSIGALIMVIVVGASQMGWFPQSSGGTGGTTGGSSGNIVVDVQGTCPVTDTTLTVGNAEDKYTPTTTYTSDFHQVIVNGQSVGLLADAATSNRKPGDTVRILTAFNATSEYSREMTFTVGCDGSLTASALPDKHGDGKVFEVGGADGRDAFKLVQNRTSADAVTLTQLDEFGNVQSAAGANIQAIAAGETKCLVTRVQAPSRAGNSPHGKLMLVYDVNKTLVANAQVQTGATGVSVGTTPNGHTQTGAIGMTASTDIASYPFEVNGLADNAKVDVPICFRADSTNNPTGFGNVTVTIYDQDWYRDSISGEFKKGYETDTRGNVGGPNFQRISTVTFS